MNLTISFLRYTSLILYLFASQIYLSAQTTVSERNQSLHPQINLYGLDYEWFEMSEVNNLKNELELLSSYGFKSIRLPIQFAYWADYTSPYSIYNPEYINGILGADSIVKWSNQLGMKVILDYHFGYLENLSSGLSFEEEVERTGIIWQQLANHFASVSADSLLFEIYNEPYMDNSKWNYAAPIILNSLRQFEPFKTVVMAFNYANSIAYMDSLISIADTNLIYSIHFYDPFLFTHQGATWIGLWLSTENIPYPYQEDLMPPPDPEVNLVEWGLNYYNNYSNVGNIDDIRSSLIFAKNWSLENNKPIYMGETGCLNCQNIYKLNYLSDVADLTDSLNIPMSVWEHTSLFNGGVVSNDSLIANILCALNIDSCNNYSILTENEINSLCVYPNPTKGLFFFKNPTARNGQFKVFDSNNHLILEKEISKTNYLIEIDLSKQPKGIYFVSYADLKTENTIKLIVE